MKKHNILLLMLFLLSIAIRLYFAFHTPNFSEDSAYFTMRQTEGILETALPVYHDLLSYSGRNNVFLPLYYYLLSFFGLFMPVTLVLKIIPNVLAATLVFAVYLISMALTNKKNISLAAAASSIFIPVFMGKTLNHASPYSLVIPLVFFLLYLFIRIGENKKFATFFIPLFVVLVKVHPSALLLVFSFLIYFSISKLEGLKINKAQIELFIFSLLFIVWFYFVFFKRLILNYGISLVWQNVPTQLLMNYFHNFTIIDIATLIGVIPFLAGIFVLYKFAFDTNSSKMYVLIAFAISIFIVIWFKLMAFDKSLMFLGTILVILFAKFLDIFDSYLNRTKLFKFKPLIFFTIAALFFLTSFTSSLMISDIEVKKSFSEEEVNALLWLKDHSFQSEKVLGVLEEGHIINAIAKRATVIDGNFLLIPHINTIIDEVDSIYKTSSEIEAVRILNKYDVDYIYFSDRAKLKYKKTELSYTEDEHCFRLVYDNGPQIYKSMCRLETVK